MVEHVPEEHSVDGSIPSPGTSLLIIPHYLLFLFILNNSFNLKVDVLWLSGRVRSYVAKEVVKMKQVSSNKSNIAWFKLAEFVGRGERERAFSLYRLLIHSLDDEPFLKKLEADIWIAFDEKEARALYLSAAHLYRKSGRLVEALLIYELLVELFPSEGSYTEKVIALCQELGRQEKELEYQQKWSHLLLNQGAIEKGLKAFKLIEKKLKESEITEFHKNLVIFALQHNYTEQKIIKNSLKNSLDSFLRSGDAMTLKTFLSKISSLNNVWHKDAQAYLKTQT